MNKFSLFKSDLFTHTSFLFYHSVRVLQIFEVDWEGEMQQYEPLLCVQNLSLFTSPLCSTLPSVLSLHTQVLSVLAFYVFISSHTSSLFYPFVCVLICSHTSHLFCPSVFLSVHTHTQGLPILPLCLCFYLFTHKSLFYPSVFLSVYTRHLCSTCLCYLFTHKSSLFCPSLCVVCSHVFSVLPFCLSVFLSVHSQVLVLPLYVLICSHTNHPCSTHLCSYLFTHSHLFYPSVCVLFCSHPSSPCSTPLSVFLSVHTQALVLPLCLSVLSVHTQVLVLPLCLSVFFRSLRWTGKERRSSMSHSRHCTTASFCGTGHVPPTLLAFCHRVCALPLQRPPWYVLELGIRCLSEWLHV